jgi:hypothetical protein
VARRHPFIQEDSPVQIGTALKEFIGELEA